MDTIAKTSPLLAKVVRGAHLPGAGRGGPAAAGAFPRHAPAFPEDPDGTGEPIAVPDADAASKRPGAPAGEVRPRDDDSGERRGKDVSSPVVPAAPGVENERRASGVDRSEAFPDDDSISPATAEQQGANDIPGPAFHVKRGRNADAAAPEREDAGSVSVRTSGSEGEGGSGSGEGRLLMPQAGRLRTGRERRPVTDGVLKAIFPAAGFGAGAAAEKGGDAPEDGTGVHDAFREASPAGPSGSVRDGQLPHLSAVLPSSPGEEPALRSGRPRQEETVRDRDTDLQAERDTVPIAAVRSRINALAAAEETPFTPPLRNVVPAPQQAHTQKTPARREGSVKIGKINIVVKERDRAKNEDSWPETPAYADHQITEDWDWSCRYGR